MAELRFGGGINSQDDELVQDDECVEGANFLLTGDSRQFRPRKPFDLKGTAPNGGEVRGLMQLIERDDTTTQLVQAGELLYSWDGSSTFTTVATVNASSKLRGTYWSLDDLLVITDIAKLTTVRTWNGTSVSTLSHGISGVTNLYAKYGIVWQNRLWLLNITTDSTDNPHVILASEFDNYDNLNNALTPTATTLTRSSPFFLTIPDLRPINGVAGFYDRLLISTVDGKIFQLIGSDASDYRLDEFYPGSSAAGTEAMVTSGNDVFYLRKGGHIERLISSDRFGDTAADDLSRYIRSEVVDQTTCIAVYDQARQQVLFFFPGKIMAVDKYVLESSELSPWMKWTTQMATNLDVEAALYLRIPGDTDYTVYFGGPQGQVYNLNGVGTGDAGSTLVKAYRKSRLISEMGTVDQMIAGRVHYRRKGVCNLDMTFEWSEEYSDTRCVVPLKGPITSAGTILWGGDVYWGGDALYWGAGGTSEERVSTAGFSAVGRGPSFFLTLSINSTVNFLVNKIEA